MATRFRLKEPFNSLSHAAGIPLSIVALVALLLKSRGDGWKITSFSIYGACLIILYLASTLYHSVHGNPRAMEWCRKFDHCAIYLLIAGSYTPICLVGLRNAWGWGLFIGAWTVALTGIGMQVFWHKMPVWIHVVLYLIMGWMSLIGIGPIYHGIGIEGVRWLIAGGVIYTIGAIIFAVERPRLWPKVFGFHELWHLFVLAGSGAHFVMMLALLQR